MFSPLHPASHLLDARSLGVVADMKDYYTTLGVGRNATRKEIRDAYLELARECHPDHQAREGQWTLVNEKFAEITEAYAVLFDERKRANYDRQLLGGVKGLQTQQAAAKTQAEKAFRNGLERFKNEDYASAQAFFKAAVGLDGKVAKYKSYQGLAQAHTGYRVGEAIELCKTAIKSELYNSELYVNLAIVNKLAGNEREYEKNLMEALKWNAKNKRALDMLDEIKKKGSLMRKIFGKG